MTKQYLKTFCLLFLGLLGMAQTAMAADFKDFAVDLRDANGGILTSEEAGASQTITFGLSVDESGTVTRVAADAANTAAVITGGTGNNHGLQSFSATVPVSGAVKITMGTCSWGGDVTVKDAGGNTVATFSTLKGGGSGCYVGGGMSSENIISTKYVGEATTLTISGGKYVGFFAVEAVTASAVEVSYSLGDVVCEGQLLLTGGTYAAGDKYTIPAKNFTLYKDGYTLTGWTDGTKTYATGEEITLEGDLALTPVFTENTVNLADRTEEVSVNFYLDGNNGHQKYTQNNGIIVTQATVGSATIDVKADIAGTIATNNNGWHQVKNSFAITVPSCKGATMAVNTYGDPTGKVIFGDGAPAETTGSNGNYTITATIQDATETLVIKQDGSDYWRNIAIVLPVVQSAGGKTYTDEEVNVEWPMDEPTNYTKYTASTEGVFSTIGVDLGIVRLMDEKGNENVTGTSNVSSGVTFSQMRPTNDGNDYVTWNVKPAAGLTFTPKKITAYIVRFGTDSQNGVTISAKAGEGDAVTLGNYTAPRNNKSKADDKYGANSNYAENGFVEITLTEAQQTALTSGETLSIMGTIGVGNSKAGGIAKVTVSGLINGTAADVAKYTLAIAANPAEGGSVTKYPNADEYEEDTEVTLTATENFGYDFQNWTNAAGDEVSTDAKFKYTIKSDETLTANFKKVNTYELKLTVDGTNDYMVTISPAPTNVDGKKMYEEGTKVMLTANQYEGLVTFSNWNDGTTNSEQTVTMDGDKDITASYSEADIIAGWDFYKKGNSGRKADFASSDNETAALSLVLTSDGTTTTGWLDKSTESLNGGTYEGFTGAATNWVKGTENGDVGKYHWQTKVNAEAFTDINVQFQMVFNYNAYHIYDVEYSTDGTKWTKAGSTPEMTRRKIVKYDETLPEACNNQKDLYIRMVADKNSTLDTEVPSQNDGNTLAMFFITGTQKAVDDGKNPSVESTVPENGATGASATGKIVLNFSEKVQLAENATATLGDLSLTGSASGKTVTFPYKGLDYETAYTFKLAKTAVTDLFGNNPEEDITLTFTTMTRPSVEKGLYDVVVSNVDELVDAINTANTRSDKSTRFRIFLKKGTYALPSGKDKHYHHAKTENNVETQVYFDGDRPDPITYVNGGNISFIGEDRDETVITQAAATETFAGQYGTTSIYDGIGNSDVLQLTGDDYYFQDITIKSGIGDALGRNLAIQDKSKKTIYKNVCLFGYQDTWTSNNDKGLYYFEGGVLRGRTDYLCGKGDAYFDEVELMMTGTGGYLAVPSTPANIGWVFKGCTISSEKAETDGNYTLGRPWGKGTPVAVFIDTKMNVVPSAIGWSEMSGGWPARFAEYNSTTASGGSVDLSGRKKTFADTHPNDPELTAAEAAEYSDKSKMFGDWDPTLLTEQAPVVTDVKLEGNTLSWTGNNYSLLYAICKDGEIIDFTTETTYDISSASTSRRSGGTVVYSVRAANEMGGLSEAVVASGTDGIQGISNAEDAVKTEYYNLQGQRVTMLHRGVLIEVKTLSDGSKVTTKRIVK